MPRPAFARWAACSACAIILGLPSYATGAAFLRTPLEAREFARITSAAEAGDFLKAVENRDSRARHAVVGVSTKGKPIDALFVSEALNALSGGGEPGERLRVMIVGSLHGTEPAGAEAILMLARDLVQASPRGLLEFIEFILVPVGNPDAYESGTRLGGARVNLSALTSPENRAIVDMIVRWRPDVFIDLHEATAYKPETLARQDYLTDFEAQIEIANNPNVDAAVRELSRERIRPAIILRLQRQGLRANDYIGEIREIGQPIAHGNLTVRNLRNRAGMEGAFSLLVENRLDPPGGNYPTPHNIRERTAKQLLSLRTVVRVCLAERREIAARSRAAQKAWRKENAGERVFLVATYALDPKRETVSIRLRRIADRQPENRTFPYRGHIAPSHALVLPGAYAITAHQDEIGVVLKRQHIRYDILREARECRATVLHVSAWDHTRSSLLPTSKRVDIEERIARVHLPAGSLWISLKQPERRLIPLLLEPQSNSSLYEHRDYAGLVTPGKDFFMLRMTGECTVSHR